MSSSSGRKKTAVVVPLEEDATNETPPAPKKSKKTPEIDTNGLDLPPAAKKRKTGATTTAAVPLQKPPSPATTTKRMQVVAGPKVTQLSDRYAFFVCLEHVTSFRRMTDTIANVGTQITFEVYGAKTAEDFQGIRFHSMLNTGQQFFWGSHSLMVSHIGSPDFVTLFTVNIAPFAKMIQMIPPNHVTKIYQLKGGEKVVIESYDPLTRRKKTMKVDLLDKHEDTSEGQQIISKLDVDYTVEFSLEEIDRILHHVETLKSTNVGFHFLQNAQNKLTVRIVTEGDNASYAESFPVQVGEKGVYKVAGNMTGKFILEEEDDPDMAATARTGDEDSTESDEDAGQMVMSLYFQVKSIIRFLKSLEKSTISLSFCKDSCITLQYHCTSNFAAQDDFMNFMVGVAVENEA